MTESTQTTIMLIDDDKFLLDMYSVKFTQAGFLVSSHFSTQEAIAALRGGEKPDAILFDITMPGIDGFGLLQTIQTEKLAPQAKLIALTNQSSEEDRKRGEELGAHRYVIKASMIPSEVVNMVKDALGTVGKN